MFKSCNCQTPALYENPFSGFCMCVQSEVFGLGFSALALLDTVYQYITGKKKKNIRCNRGER